MNALSPQNLRRIILQQSKRAHVGHIGSSLSIADIIVAFYANILRIPDPADPDGGYSYQTDVSRIIETNVVGTSNLLQACLKTGFEAFVNTGSSSEYGFKDHAPSECEWVEPNSDYAVTKVSATLLCRYAAQSHQMHIPTLRLYAVYGPYEEPTRLMPTLIHYGRRGELPPLVQPDIARDFVYVADVNEAYLMAAATPHQELGAVYNIGTGVQTSLREVVGVVRRVLHITAEPQWGSMPDRQWDTTCWVADNHYAREVLGWIPRYSFEQGFQELVAWETVFTVSQ